MAMLLALAAPTSAKVKEREAKGTTAFTLVINNPEVDLDADPPIFTAQLDNPGTKTGTFKGTQLYSVDYVQNLVDNTFTVEGTVVFFGRVKACGYGLVIFDVSGHGVILDDGAGAADFFVQDQTVSGGTLPLEGWISETGTGVSTGDATGTIEYEGSYSCDHSGKG